MYERMRKMRDPFIAAVSRVKSDVEPNNPPLVSGDERMKRRRRGIATTANFAHALYTDSLRKISGRMERNSAKITREYSGCPPKSETSIHLQTLLYVAIQSFITTLFQNPNEPIKISAMNKKDSTIINFL
jgi:hypothetical protein